MPVLVAGLVAFNPQFLFISASVNNDNLMTALASLTLLMVTSLAVRAPACPPTARIIAPGVLGGLAALSKLTGVGLLGSAAVALLQCAGARILRWLVGASWLVGGLAFLIAGWWYVRN